MKLKKYESMNQNKFKKAKTIEEDQGKLYIQILDLTLQAFHVSIVRDVVREYRGQREKTMQEYNILMNVSHVALANYSLQQFWKLFDKKSVFNVWHVVNHMPHPNLKAWFEKEIASIKDDLDNIEILRHNLVSHRSEGGHIERTKFDKDFFKGVNHEARIKDFLIELISQIKFEMKGASVDETKKNFLKDLESYKNLIVKDQEKAFRSIE